MTLRTQLALLCILALSMLSGKVVFAPPSPLSEPFFNVLDYGAVADAVEASGCDANEDVPMNCTSAGSGTDNQAFFQAAVDAACTARDPDNTVGGRIWIPNGKYRIDSVVRIDCDNVTVECESHGAMLLPGTTGGGYLFAACQLDSGVCDTTPSNNPNNVHFKGCYYLDDDPWAHGSTWSEQATVSSISGAFAYNEVITFETSSPGATINFYWQSATTGGGELIYRLSDSAQFCSGCADTITGARSSATAEFVSMTWARQSEETHAIFLAADDSSITGNRFDHFGDEAIDVTGLSKNSEISDNVFWNNPATPSQAASISISNGATYIDVLRNDIEIGVSGSSKGIDVASASTEVSDITIRGNTVTEDDIGNADHSVGEFAIVVKSITTNILRTTIDDNRISFDLDDEGTCSGAPADTACSVHTDCGGVQTCTNATLDCESCESIQVGESADGSKVIGIAITNNDIVGRIESVTTGTDGWAMVSGNRFTGTVGSAMRVVADTVHILDNIALDYPNFAVNISSAADEIIIDGNTFLDIGSGLTGTSAVILPSSAPTRMTVTNNHIRGETATSGVVRGIWCRATDYSIVQGNTITDTDDHSIFECQSVIGNTIKDSAGAGILMTAAEQGGRVIGNHIESSANDAINLSGVQGVLVMGNHCLDVDNNVCVQEENTTTNNNVIVGNTSADADAIGATFNARSAAQDVCDGNTASATATVCANNIRYDPTP